MFGLTHLSSRISAAAKRKRINLSKRREEITMIILGTEEAVMDRKPVSRKNNLDEEGKISDVGC